MEQDCYAVSLSLMHATVPELSLAPLQWGLGGAVSKHRQGTMKSSNGLLSARQRLTSVGPQTPEDAVEGLLSSPGPLRVLAS